MLGENSNRVTNRYSRTVRWAIRRGAKRPYFHLPGYMFRYWLLGGSARDTRPESERGWKKGLVDYLIGRWICMARLHGTMRGDEDRHLHDHPSWNISIVLGHGYHEMVPVSQKQHPALDKEKFCVRWRGPGSVVIRRRHHRHRILMPDDQRTFAWSIWIRGPRWFRGKGSWKWGFYTRRGKIEADQYFQAPPEFWDRPFPFEVKGEGWEFTHYAE